MAYLFGMIRALVDELLSRLFGMMGEPSLRND